MSDYSTNLISWGATGSAYPTGYSLLEGEQPVDDWDNFLRYNTIEDLFHLIDLTNNRIESGSGSAFPTNPDPNHLFYRSDEERAYTYNSTQSSWEGLMKVKGDTIEGDLDLGNNALLNVGSLSMNGLIDLSGNDLKDSSTGTLLYDSSEGHIPLNGLQNSKVTVNVGSHLSGGGTISLGESMSVSINDDFVENDGDILSGGLTVKQGSGSNNYTAEDTATGDRFALRTTSGDNFEFVGYDNSDGVWDYDSSLEYDPSSGDWNFNSLLEIRGDDVATRPWVSGNNVNHRDLADAPSDAHHTRYADSEAVSAVNSDTDHGSSASHNYFSGNHTDLSSISADDHHSRYSDSEAQSAVDGSNHNHDSRYYQPDGNDAFVNEVRTSDPSSPQDGRSWIIQ